MAEPGAEVDLFGGGEEISTWTVEGINDEEDAESFSEVSGSESPEPLTGESQNPIAKKGRAKGQQRKKRPPNKDRVRQKKSVCTVEGCRYSTPYPKDLARHMRKHTGEKPFTCDICSKSFSRYDKLVAHKRAHGGVRPYKCESCNYASLDASSLRKHIRIHTDERPYSCQLCPYKARDSSQIIVHMRHHTGDSPYICTYKSCQAGFKTPSDLARHERHHSGEKPFACSQCEYRAAVKCNLNAHVKKYHNLMKLPADPAVRLPIPEQALAQETTEAMAPAPGDLDTRIAEPSPVTLLELTEQTPNQGQKPPSLDYHFACKQCDYKGETIRHFQSHMRRKHKVTQPAIRDPRTGILQPPKKRNTSIYPQYFFCMTCSAKFVREDSLRCHVKQHKAMGPPPMPIIQTIDTLQVKNLTSISTVPSFHASQTQTSPSPYLADSGEYLGQVQAEEVIVESVNVRPQVITFADRICTDSNG